MIRVIAGVLIVGWMVYLAGCGLAAPFTIFHPWWGSAVASAGAMLVLMAESFGIYDPPRPKRETRELFSVSLTRDEYDLVDEFRKLGSK